jgi:hypothetical protein
MSGAKTSKWGSSFFGTVPQGGEGVKIPSATPLPSPADREVDRSVVDLADEAQQGDGPQIATDNAGKIKFKRAKKLAKKGAGGTQQYTKAFTDTKSSRFQVSVGSIPACRVVCVNCISGWFAGMDEDGDGYAAGSRGRGTPQ